MNTKHLILSTLALLASYAVQAQDIAVQAPDNSTVIYHDINKAIYNAPAGSTVFLPAGSFTVSDTILIKKKLTIVGVGHRSDTPGGHTQVAGNFNFRIGSDNSSLLGVYLTGNVNIANAEGAVNNFILQFCNINSLQVTNSSCDSFINQNFIRAESHGGQSSMTITNNIISGRILDLNKTVCSNNVFTSGYPNAETSFIDNINNSVIKNNFLEGGAIGYNAWGNSSTNNIIRNNIFSKDYNYWGTATYGENYTINSDWNNIFINFTNNLTLNDYHLKSNIGKNAGTDGTDIGIYGGTGFSDTALPPYPQITFKNIPGQTDEYGNLKIQVKVRAQ